MNDLDLLYRDVIRKHAAQPVGFRRPIDATHQHEADNPLCGDRILIQLRIVNGELEAAAFDGEACAICMASASLLCEHAGGSSPASVLDEQAWLAGRLGPEGSDELPEDSSRAELMPLLGVRQYPSRIRCALLPWEAVEEALTD